MSRHTQIILSFLFLFSTTIAAPLNQPCSDHMTIPGLIKPSWVHLDYQQLDGRRVIYYFINAHGNRLLLKPGVTPQNLLLNPRAISAAYQQYIHHALQRLSKVINLRFIRINNKNKSDFTINATCAPDSDILGQSAGLAQHSNQINIIVNLCAGNTLVLHKKIRSAFLHELGHVLGLEHPFDDSDGDCIFTTKVWSQHSATQTNTLMAYRFQDQYYDWYRPHDIQALIAIWGAANKKSSLLKKYRLIK